MTGHARFAFTPDDLQRLERVSQLVASGPPGIAPLVELLDDPNWRVRRAVVAGLAAEDVDTVGVLCRALRTRRESERRIAATVDALAMSNHDPVPSLIAMVADAEPAVLADVAQILGRRRATAALPTLTALTRHADDNVAVAAIEALGKVGGSAAVDSLVETIGGGNFFRTFPAIDVLGRCGDPRAVAPLTAKLDEPPYATEAARALGRTGDRVAALPLLRLMGRGGGATVRVAALALKDLRQKNAEHFGSSEQIDEAIRQNSDPGLSWQITRALSDGDAGEKAALCALLGVMEDVAAAPALTALLDGPPEVVEAAAEALKRIGPEADAHILREIRAGGLKRALLPLVATATAAADVEACLGDPDPDVRVLACDALGRMGATGAVRKLFPLLRDSNPRVAFTAMGAIQALGGQETERLTLAAMRSADARERRAAVRILGYFGFPSALEAYLETLRDPDERVREASIQGLPFFEDPRARVALFAATKDPDARTRAAALRALGQCSADLRASAYLLRGLTDADPWARYYACQSLGKLTFEPAAEAIGRLLTDEAGQVRVAAVEALSFLRSEPALKALEAAAVDEEPDVRRAALVGLGVARRKESLPILLAAATSQDAATRIVVLSALAGFESPDALRVLVEAAVDSDEGLRTVALGLLAGMPGIAVTGALAGLLRSSPSRERVVDALSVHVAGRVPGILAALEDADEETAAALTWALARIRRADATEALLGTMTSSNVRARKAAATTLAGLGSADTLAVLRIAAAKDPEPEVRRICSLLLAR